MLCSEFKKTILLLSCFFVSSVALGEIKAISKYSKIKLTSERELKGSWVLKTSAGVECAKGKFESGIKNFEIPKVAKEFDLELEVTSENSKEKFVFPKQNNFSPLKKISQGAVIYQLPVRTWSAQGDGESLSGKLSYLSDSVLGKIKAFGADYLWVTGVIESASLRQTDPDVVKGNAGSYYAIYDSWDVAEELGGLEEFDLFIERAHGAGLRVILDLVPNHTARNHRTDVACKSQIDFGFDDDSEVYFDINNNYYYLPDTIFFPPEQNEKEGADGQFDRDIFTGGVQYEIPAKATGNDVLISTPSINDWFETSKLNYGFDLITRQSHYNPRPKTWDKILDVAKYWTAKGVDGFRIDFAHAVPIEFWRYFASNLKAHQPNVFLLAEAYENDTAMKLPGFSNQAMFEAGFDSVYNSELYWALRHGISPRVAKGLTPRDEIPVLDEAAIDKGYMFTNYIENHDEVRAASRFFAPHLSNKIDRGNLGKSYSAWAALMPSHFLMQGGQELLEEADIYGPFAGDNGKTSIFDFVHQSEVKRWMDGESSEEVLGFRNDFQRILELKHSDPFNSVHTSEFPTYMDLTKLNIDIGSNPKILSYIRYNGSSKHLVIMNSDPYQSHEVTIHFTSDIGVDSKGALEALGVENSWRWYEFVEIMFRPGWVPKDPAFERRGTPGWALYRGAGIPSGLFLGQMNPGQVYVFKLKVSQSQ